MHEEQNNAPVKTVQSNRQEANFPNLEEKENLKQFYLTQSRRLCPTVSVDRSELQRLGALHHKIKHFIKALTNLDRSWENGMPEMQKACLHFFTLQNSPRTECQKIFEIVVLSVRCCRIINVNYVTWKSSWAANLPKLWRMYLTVKSYR